MLYIYISQLPEAIVKAVQVQTYTPSSAIPASGQLDCFRLLECLLSPRPCEWIPSKLSEKAGLACSALAAAADSFRCGGAGSVSEGVASVGKSLADTSPGVRRTIVTSRARIQ